MRLGVVSTHLIQYLSALYRELAKRVDALEVAYLRHVPRVGGTATFDVGFGCDVQWDVDLRSGYPWTTFNLRDVPYSFDALDVIRTFHSTSQWLRTFRPDAVVVPGWTGLYPIVAATARACGTRVVLRPEGRIATLRPVVHEVGRSAVLRHLIKLVDAAAYTSTSSRDELVRLGIPAERLAYSPYVIDEAAWRPLLESARSRRDTLRSSLGFASDDVVYLFVGKLAHYKRVLELVDAFSRVASEVPRARLLIVGDGPQRKEVEARCGARGLASHVVLFGFANQSQLPGLHAASDVFVLLSQETWGLVANEALLAGLPLVISVEAGCSRDLVLDGETGFRVSPSDPEDCARRLIQLADPELRARMKPAIERVANLFTLERSADGVIRALELAMCARPEGRVSSDPIGCRRCADEHRR